MRVPPFRRRCAWCAVQLRLWQLNLCRKCKTHVTLNLPSPNGGLLGRAHERPDRMRTWR